MRHAIMVMGYGNIASVLQSTINVLDSYNIDFFIHWDARYKLPMLTSQKSKLYFLKNRISVHWGSGDQIKTELLLMNEVNKNNNDYDYVHLISSNDAPLMDSDYFEKYFENEVYIGFDKKITQDIENRIKFYYPCGIDYRKHVNIRRLFKYGNSFFKINKLNKFNVKVEKGPNWFSMKAKYINEVLNYNNDIFKNTFCGDEIFLQIILARFKSQRLNYTDVNEQALRYVDWKRGRPYTFTLRDINELKDKKNTHFAFVRKIKDPLIILKLYDIK